MLSEFQYIVALVSFLACILGVYHYQLCTRCYNLAFPHTINTPPCSVIILQGGSAYCSSCVVTMLLSGFIQNPFHHIVNQHGVVLVSLSKCFLEVYYTFTLHKTVSDSFSLCDLQDQFEVYGLPVQ